MMIAIHTAKKAVGVAAMSHGPGAAPLLGASTGSPLMSMMSEMASQYELYCILQHFILSYNILTFTGILQDHELPCIHIQT